MKLKALEYDSSSSTNLIRAMLVTVPTVLLIVNWCLFLVYWDIENNLKNALAIITTPIFIGVSVIFMKFIDIIEVNYRLKQKMKETE